MWKFITYSVLIYAIVCPTIALEHEPVCSKFDYEIKTLETMLRTEQKVEITLKEMKDVKTGVKKDLDELIALERKLETDFQKLEQMIENKASEKLAAIGKLERTVENKVSEKLAAIGKLERTVENKVSEKLAKMDAFIQRAEGKVSAKLAMIDEDVERHLKQIADSDKVVAFSVKHPTKKLVDGVPLFSTTITNIGGGYKPNTGVFTSPVNGLYMFVFTVVSAGKYQVYCYIRHNGTNQVYAHTSFDNQNTSASVSVYLLLDKGDSVKLANCYNWDKVDAGKTVFSGALIKQNIKG